LFNSKGRNAGPAVHKLGAFGGAIGTVLNTGALFIFSQAIANKSPTQPGPKPATGEKKDPEVRGILRVTRHPMFTALGTWGLGNCFKRGRLGDLGTVMLSVNKAIEISSRVSFFSINFRLFILSKLEGFC